jgi:leader peptidase (prepilin peptidase)/N-methyltransferase
MLLDFVICIFIFVFGLCIGSFLNCAIYRLEENKKITGRSFCPNCKHALQWRDLFPVFSFLVLKGKCRYCKEKISIQYPLVEIATGLIFLLIFNFVNFRYNTVNLEGAKFMVYLNLAFLFYIAGALIIIFVYDFKHYIIPDKILWPAIAIALIYDLIPPYNAWNLFYTFLAVVIAAGFFWVIFFFSKGKWMGFGDVKLAVLMGLLLGLPNVLAALFLAFFFGAIIGIILMALKKKNLKSEIPFGPFLIAGTFLAMLYGNQIIQWYLSFFQI